MSDIPLAARMRDIEPFYVMDILARARELERAGRSVIHMEIGEPDFVTPRPIIEAGCRALAQGHTHYTPAMGLPELRAAIGAYYGSHSNVDVPPDRVVVTPGSSSALQLALTVLVDPGADVLLADPGYPCNRHFVRLTEGRAVGIPVGPETAYQLTAERVERHWTERTRALLVASPANPTGTIVAREEMQALIALCAREGAALIVDEIYHGLVYEQGVSTALADSDRIFVINSFSKYFGMTGWRVGWLVAPQPYVREFDKLAQNLYLSAPTPSQWAALAAFEPETLQALEDRRAEFQRRRDWLYPALQRLGFRLPVRPQGAFYLYADCGAFTGDSRCWASDLLERAGVAVTPGLDFGRNAPDLHVRFAYTTALENLQEGVRRIESFLGSGGKGD